MKKPLALVDLDGTLADFQGAMRRDLEALRSPSEPPTVDFDDEKQAAHIKARWHMIKHQPDWWFNLEFLPSGAWLVQALKMIGYKIHLLSRAPRRNPGAWEQKVRWGMRHVPDAEMTLTPTKGNFYGRVLVDDWPSYIEPWLEHRPRGLVIMPDQPWNQDLKHDQIIRHVFPDNNEEVRAALIAHNREGI